MATGLKIRTELYYALKKRNMKQKDLAKKAGLHPVQINYFCSGKKRPCIENQEKIAKVLKLSKNKLFN